MERPEVDKIEDSVQSFPLRADNFKEPKIDSGTVTELSDFLRLLFARASTAFSYNSGEPMIVYRCSNCRTHW